MLFGGLHLFQCVFKKHDNFRQWEYIYSFNSLWASYFFLQEEDLPPEMPVTHDSMRLIDQAKAICEQRIYLDEAKELYSLISSKWMRVGQHLYFELSNFYFKFALGIFYNQQVFWNLDYLE